jgi:hypothetical protein
MAHVYVRFYWVFINCLITKKHIIKQSIIIDIVNQSLHFNWDLKEVCVSSRNDPCGSNPNTPNLSFCLQNLIYWKIMLCKFILILCSLLNKY